MDKKIQTNSQTRAAVISINTFNKESKTFDVVFASENPVLRHGWDETFNEILLCQPENVRSERLAEGLPLFDNHPYDKKTTEQLGRCNNIRFEDSKLVGTITLGARADDALITDIENGIVKGISVGYNVYRFISEQAVGQDIPNYKATDWEPLEVSFAPVQADIKSGIRSEENKHELIIKTETMAEETKPTETVETVVEKTEEVVAVEAVDIEAVRKANTTDQNTRLNAILLSTRAAKMEDAKAIEFHLSEKPIEEIRQLIINDFVKTDTKINAMSVEVGKEAIDKKRAGVEEALLHRIAPSQFKLEGANEFRGMTLMEIGKELLTERGVNTRAMSKAEVADTVFTGKRDMSTSDFPLLLEGLANKMLRNDYTFAPEYWDLIAKQTSVSDFKAKNLYQVDSVNGMQESPEGDEIKYGKLVESKQTIKVKKYSEGLLFTREAFINDDMSAFSLIPNRFVLDWNTIKGDLIWGMVTTPATMADGKALFHTDHKNLASTAGVIADTSLETALIALKAQTGIDGKRRIRIMPKYLIVSPTYEITARKLLTVVAPTQVSQVNVFSSMGLTIIVEPRLSGKAWYLTADPNAIDGLYYAYLDGNGGLRSNRIDDFDTDSIKFGVRGEFGVAAIDYRGWYKNAGE